MQKVLAVVVAAMNGFASHDRGASGVEYGILLAAVAAVIAAGAYLVGSKTGANFTTTNSVIP